MAATIEDYYRKYGPMVLRRCRTLLVDEAQSVEAMQDTFVQVVENTQFWKDEAPSATLYRTATDVCFNKINSDNGRAGLRRNTPSWRPLDGQKHKQTLGFPMSRLSTSARAGRLTGADI